MAVYTGGKDKSGSEFPNNAIDGQDFGRREPLIDAQAIKDRFLFGIPLVSAIANPLTQKHDVLKDEVIEDIIQGAVARCEEDAGVDIFPVVRRERHPFDANLMKSWGYVQLEHRPVLHVQSYDIVTNNGDTIFRTPIEWLDSGYFWRGQIHLVPLMAQASNGIPGAITAAGQTYINIIGSQPWVPGFWTIEYTSGFENGNIPRIVNDLIGMTAAQEILGMLAATNRASSYSLGMDAMSQSVSTPGPQVYEVRLKQLEEKRHALLNRLKVRFGRSLIVGTI